jgi:hypothetical protein
MAGCSDVPVVRGLFFLGKNLHNVLLTIGGNDMLRD